MLLIDLNKVLDFVKRSEHVASEDVRKFIHSLKVELGLIDEDSVSVLEPASTDSEVLSISEPNAPIIEEVPEVVADEKPEFPSISGL